MSGRHDPFDLFARKALDWWRVEDIKDTHRQHLGAQMPPPGLAWLELIIDSNDQGRTLFRRRALLHPPGLGGHHTGRPSTPFTGWSSAVCSTTSPMRPRD